MIRRLYTVHSYVLLILDVSVLVIAYGAAYLIKLPGTHHVADVDIYNTFLLIQIICWLLIASTTRFYPKADSPHFIRHIAQMFQNWIALVVISFAILVMVKVSPLFSRTFLLVFYSFFIVGMLILRAGHFTMVRHGTAGMKRRILFVGDGVAIRQLFDRMIDIPHYAVVGITSSQDIVNKIKSTNGDGVNPCEKFLEDENVDEVLLALSGMERSRVIEIVNFCEDLSVRVTLIPDYVETVYGRGLMEELEGVPVVALRTEPLDNGVHRFLKRTFDILFSGAVVVLLLPPVTLIVGIVTLIISPGPIFFRQERTGLNGKVFKLWKFRTMEVADRSVSDTEAAQHDDPRVTRFGSFLRKTSIDELPQFINVLAGNMSVVGPRPHMLAHTDQYRSLVSKYMVRHFVKPGLTGWAQINGYRGTTEHLFLMEKRVEYDIYYIENWSFLLDIQIILLTIAMVLRGDKNAF